MSTENISNEAKGNGVSRIVSGSVRIQMPLEYAETLHGLINGVIGSCDDDELVRQLTTIFKKLDKGIKKHYR